MPEYGNDEVKKGGAAPGQGDGQDAREDVPAEAAGAADDVTSEDGEVDEVAELRAEAERNYANWQRSAADFANYKRRMEDERKEWARIAQGSVVIGVLPAYDDLGRAVETVDAKLAGLNWVQGIEAIYRKFGRALEGLGVEEVRAEGEAFDPALHEAVGESPGEEGRVLHVAQRGYRIGERVIRPAMVIVGNGETGPGGAEASQGNQ